MSRLSNWLSRFFSEHWYQPRPTWLAWVLLPFTILYGIAVEIRASLYRHGFLQSYALPVPVVVVGNVTVGGTGKTPFVIALIHALRECGFTPGVISRGYGGRISERGETACVTQDSNPAEVGDEAGQIVQTRAPMVVGRDRVAAGLLLTSSYPQVDVVVSDDGMQHYRLARTIEIALLDGARQLGNGLPLPSGPLRERSSRLAQVSAVVLTEIDGADDREPQYGVPLFRQALKADTLRQANRPENTMPLTALMEEEYIHAIAGIGNPDRFFQTLDRAGIHAEQHIFSDHFFYTPGDLALPNARWIIMTEKDAVKCRAFADDRCWYLPVTSSVALPLLHLIDVKLRHARKN